MEAFTINEMKKWKDREAAKYKNPAASRKDGGNAGGLAYSLVIKGAAFWEQLKITYRPRYPALTAASVLAATKFINHMKCFSGMG